MNIVKFAFINRGLCAAERDWKKAFGRDYARSIVKGQAVEFEDCGYADYVMDWLHEGQLCDVYLNEGIIVKKEYLALPERITCLSSVKTKSLILKVFAEICAKALGINSRYIKQAAKNATIIQMTETPCKGFLSIASSIDDIIEQIASLAIDNNNEYHVVLTLFDYREKQIIPARLANFFEIRWIGELLDLAGDELSLVDRSFDELYEKHYNAPDKSLALLTPPANCGWKNIRITIRTECDSIAQYDDVLLARDRIEFAFINAQNQVIDNAKVEVKAWDVSVFWKNQKDFKTANNAWLLLREFAFNNGTILDSRIYNTKNALSTAKGELAKILAQLCNLPSQGKSGPFPRASSKGSKCNFSIKMINIASVTTNDRNSRPYDPNME